MEVNHIFPGVHYIKEGNFSILAGCPPEIIKVLMQKNLSPPDVILLPDVPLARGESQIAVEFPLYHNLFMNPNKDKTKKLVLLGNSIRVESAKKLLKLCLTGLDLEELLEEGMEQSDAERLHNETSWFHLKNSDGTFLTIDDLVLGVVIEDEAVQMEGLQIERISPNNFRISHDTESISICMDVTEEQKPPYPINYDLIPSHLVKYGIEVLGGSTGFSATNASSGLALSHNGNYTLIDAIPYLNYHLKARGIGRNQVFSLFLSHIHDDHCNLLSLLKYNRKIKILTTHIIYRMMLKKLSYVMDRSLEEIEDYFIFVPLKPGETTNYYGVKITPHWSIHSIPTIGARFEVMHMGKNYSVLFTGDTQSLNDIENMLKKNVISQQRHLFLTNLYRKNWSLLLADGGEGLIHGSPTDAEESKADKVVFLHLDKLPERFRAQFSVASSGKRFTIISGQTDYWLTKTIEFVLGYFPDMSPNWISNLLGDLEIRTFNSDDIIIRQGAISRGEVYIVLTGYAKVIYHDGEENRLLAEVEAGELIGEMASFQGDGLRNASVVALSPVVVATFSEDAFRNFITSLGYKDKLTRLWKHRNFLQKFKCLYFLSQQVIRVLAGKARLASVEESAAPQSLLDICETGSLVFPITDDFRFYEDSEQLPVTKNVNILLADEKISYLADTASQILVIDSVEVKKLQETTPIFRYFIKEELPFHFTS